VFVDETATTTKMARRYGRRRRGQRLRCGVPHGHYKAITFVFGLRLRGGDYQEFRVRAGIMGRMEIPNVPTQRACYP
jgi:hypothetical protein